MAQAELFSPLAWPMLIPPKDWDEKRPGGYLLNEVMRGYSIVRRGNPTLIQGETPISFLNKIQKVAYTLNPFVVDVAQTLMERRIEVGKFVPQVEMPLPPNPADIDDNKDSEMSNRRASTEAYHYNAQAYKRSCRIRMMMYAVEVFQDVDKFYQPWSLDYRGHAYPTPPSLRHKIQTSVSHY